MSYDSTEPTRPTGPMPPMGEPPRRRRGIVGPVILIFFGLIFLLNNIGWLPWSVWLTLWRLWPLWLIAAGVDLLIGRRSRVGGWIAAAILVAMVSGAVWLAQTAGSGNWLTLGGGGVAEVLSGDRVRQPLEGATQADITLRTSVNRLLLQAGSDPALLVDGSAERLDGERIEKNARRSGDTMRYTLESVQLAGFHIPPGRAALWDLKLAPNVPTSLRVTTGVGESEIDLTGIQLSSLTVEAGVGKTTVTLPAAGRFSARVKAGVGNLTVRVPRGMGVRVNTKVGIGGVDVPAGYQKFGQEYTSPGFESAAGQALLELEGGVGHVEIIELS